MEYKKKMNWLLNNGLFIAEILSLVFMVLFIFIKMNNNIPYQDIMSLFLLNVGIIHILNGFKTKKIVNVILGIGFLLLSLLYLYDYIVILRG